MKAFLLLMLILLLPLTSGAQVNYSANDAEIVQSILSDAEKLNFSDSSFGSIVIHIGRQLLGTSYTGGILDLPETEVLVIDLNDLDCVTFLENTIALSILIKENKSQFDDFCSELKYLRYRDGIMNGYASRLHYFTDWIENNRQKGILENITRDIGGKPFVKNINCMSQNRAKYPLLKNDDAVIEIKGIEDKLNAMEKYYIPKDEIFHIQDKISDGDLIALTTTLEGLEVAHVGIAIRMNDVLHLMHASSLNKKVEISELPLIEMLQRKPTWSGIMVSRLRN